MRESITALDPQIQLVDKWEKRLVIKQKLLDFRTKGRVFLALKEKSKTKAVAFFKTDERLGATFRQREANRRILRKLFPPLTPILH